MPTWASPTQGGFGQPVWRVEMAPGQTGPLHALDTDLLWAVLAGAATISIGAEQVTVGPGDAVVVPAGTPRQVSADPAGDPVVPAWTI